ncbi:hypothetical protein CDI09_09270 [Komagataeibacter nataicola]|uniref:Uncharacterized protein n=1 Tax=Komagataeibacter nataicola TaxID=265960 RepID=A0ABX5PAG3_9PROT|nr:hypothetical protein CDI09_09270 [Komagataeibacter nataicola]
MMADGRIVVEFVAADGAVTPRADTLLVVGDGRQPGPAEGWAGMVVAQPAATAFTHALGCQCCLPRGGLAGLMGDLFRKRATGGLKWFTRLVVVPPPGQEALWRASMEKDVLAQARFRVEN